MSAIPQDLSKLPYGQLKSLRSQVDSAMLARQRETASKIAKIAEDTDIALDKLQSLTGPATLTRPANGNGAHVRKPAVQVTKGKAKKASTKPGQVQYRDPENPKLTWTGRGPKPKWMVARIDAGATAESLRVG
jgi:DNA-binding protein H-NS